SAPGCFPPGLKSFTSPAAVTSPNLTFAFCGENMMSSLGCCSPESGKTVSPVLRRGFAAGLHLQARLQLLRRMDDHGIARLEPRADLRFELSAVPHVDGAELRAAAPDAKDGPAGPLAEEGASGDLHHVASFPRHDPHFDAVAVAEGCPSLAGVLEIDDDVDALLFDAERGNLQEPAGFHA